MIRDELKQLKTGARELRHFGLLIGGALAALGLMFWARGKPQFPWLLWPGASLLLLGAALPRVLKPVYLVWMSLAIVLGFFVSHAVLLAFFFLVLTPVGLAARLLRKDFLELKLDRRASSYWKIRRRKTAPSRAEYERQF